MEYNKVYDFTNENVGCLDEIYNFDNSSVLSVIGSGDQYFTSVLNNSKSVDLFDINPTSYLYFLLKFYSIKKLSYEEFYDFFINKNITRTDIYLKLESVLPIKVLEYYKYLILNRKKLFKECFKKDGISINTRFNKKYYFNSKNLIIPYLIKEHYYKLQDKLRTIGIPKFYCCDFLDLKNQINQKYDIMLLSNIYSMNDLNINEYTKLLNSFDVPEIQAHYDWYANYLCEFSNNGYECSKVNPSSPLEFNDKYNLIYTLRK